MKTIPPCIGAALRDGLAPRPDAAHDDTAGYLPHITDEQRTFAVRRLLRIRAARRFATTADLHQAEACALSHIAAGDTASAALAEAERLHLPARARNGKPTQQPDRSAP